MLSDSVKQQFDTTIHAAFPDAKASEYTVEHPADPQHGDFACNAAMVLAKQLKQKPRDVAQKIVEALPGDAFEKVDIAGPGFINVFLKKKRLAEEIASIIAEKDSYGAQKLTKPLRIMLEYAQPNTNKPQHVGHMRNAIYGKAVGNLINYAGHSVIFTNYMGDIGIHIMKSMLAYMKWGEGKTPETEHMKPDHFVGKYYVMFTEEVEGNPSLMEEAQELLRKWESGDKEVRSLWEKMNAWAYEGWKITFERMGVHFDEWNYESQYSESGKEVTKDALKSGIAKQEENGAIAIDLEPYGLGKKILLRGDGTSVYMTKELTLFRENYNKHHMDRRLYVVGSDQDHYFRQFFKILELLGHDYGKGGAHLSYGMVYTKEGKMSSRAGTVINADDMLDLAHTLAEKEIAKRHIDIDEKEKDRVAEAVGVGALKYAILHVDAKQDLAFDPAEAVSFEGNTGPYLQYTHARIHSILRKADTDKSPSINFEVLNEPGEIVLLRTLYQFPETVRDAAENYKPHILCNYLFDLAQKFNAFYANVPVLKSEATVLAARLALITAVAQVLRNGLTLLGIEPLERM